MSVGFYLNVNGQKVLIVNNHLESNALDNDDKSGFGNLIKGDLNKDMARAESARLIDNSPPHPRNAHHRPKRWQDT